MLAACGAVPTKRFCSCPHTLSTKRFTFKAVSVRFSTVRLGFKFFFEAGEEIFKMILIGVEKKYSLASFGFSVGLKRLARVYFLWVSFYKVSLLSHVIA